MDSQLEKLSADIIDDDFVKVFYGLHLLQIITGRLNVQIKNGFATAPSRLYMALMAAIWATALLFLIGFTLQCESVEGSILIEFYFKIGLIINLLLVFQSVARDLKKNSSSQFYVRLQKIDRDLHFGDGKRCNENLAKYVMPISVILLSVALTWVFLFNVYCMKSFCPYATIIFWPLAANILDMTIVAFIIHFITIRVNYINISLGDIKGRSRNENRRDALLLDEKSCSLDEILWNNLLAGMRSILTVMAEFLDLYQYKIFSFTCQLMLWIMLCIQSSIVKVKNQLSLDNMSCTIIIAISMLWLKLTLLAVCITADSLSKKMKNAKKLCTDIRHTFDERNTRRNAKRMLLLLETKYELSIYDIYTLGTNVSVKLLAIIATYTIVLLQFALE